MLDVVVALERIVSLFALPLHGVGKNHSRDVVRLIPQQNCERSFVCKSIIYYWTCRHTQNTLTIKKQWWRSALFSLLRLSSRLSWVESWERGAYFKVPSQQHMMYVMWKLIYYALLSSHHHVWWSWNEASFHHDGYSDSTYWNNHLTK